MATRFPPTEWLTYTVGGHTLAEAAAELDERPEAATAEWFPVFRFDLRAGKTVGVEVDIPTRVTLPHWTGAAHASVRERAEWNRFCRALRRHEEGHVGLVRDTLSEIHRRLEGRSERSAQAIWDDALAALTTASDAYDLRTDHGRLSGTIIAIEEG